MRNLTKISIVLIMTAMVFGYQAEGRNLTPYSVKAGIFVAGNYYQSNFAELSGYPSCCPKFENAFGFGFGALVGGEYDLGYRFIGVKSSISVDFSVSDLSAKYLVEEKIGNIIYEDRYVDGITEHKLEASITAVSFEPSISFYPIEEIPLGFSLGTQLGYIYNPSFSQTEKLVSPEGVHYQETGTEKRYEYDGDLPNASSFYAAISLGVSYRALEYSFFSAVSYVKANYGLTDISNNLDWAASSLRLGVNLRYNVPEPKYIPPKESPLPPAPPTPRAEKLICEMQASCGGRQLRSGDTVDIKVFETSYYNSFKVLPIVYFEVNSDEILKGFEDKDDRIAAQSNSFELISKYLSQNPKLEAKANFFALSFEDSSVIEDRKDKLVSALEKKGVYKDRVETETIIQDSSQFERRELLEDNCRVEFVFSNGEKLLILKQLDSVSRGVEKKVLKAEPICESDLERVQIKGGFFVRGLKVFDLKNEAMVFEMKENILTTQEVLRPFPLSLKAEAKNPFGRTDSMSLNVIMNPILIEEKSYENVETKETDTSLYSLYVLGYCKFDESEFIAVNEEALKIARKTASEGSIVEIIPSFDNLGSQTHNKYLARARAEAAINIIDASNSALKVVYPEDFLFSNSSPYGRALNRAVYIRVKNR